MKKLALLVAIAFGINALTHTAHAVTYNETRTAIFGSGNPDTGWTVDTANNIEIGLRAKDRATGSTANSSGQYSFPDAPAPRGRFNYEWTINADTGNILPLSTYDFYLAVDRDPSMGKSFSVVDPLSYWGDNSFGNNTTANGAGVEPTSIAEYLAFPTTYNIAQNSQNITFGDYPGGALPLVADATYSFELYAVAKGDGENGRRLASTAIDVVVGNGGRGVPDTGTTLASLSMAVGSLVYIRRRK